MIEVERVWILVASASVAHEHIAISARCRDTSCIFGYHLPIATFLHTRTDSISSVWLHEAVLFVSMICYNIVCNGLLSMDHHIYTPVSIGTLICVQHVPPEDWWQKFLVIAFMRAEFLFDLCLHNSQMSRPMPRRHLQALTAMTSNFQFRSFPTSKSMLVGTWIVFHAHSIKSALYLNQKLLNKKSYQA